MKRGHKAQTTVFIIIAIIVVVAILLTYFITTSKARSDREFFESLEMKPKVDNIKNYVYDCREDVINEALIVIGQQGGYYTEPEEYFELYWTFIPYYYNQGKFNLPTNEFVENELAAYINNNLKGCLESLETDFKLDYKSAKTTVSINKGDINFNVDMRVNIESEDRTTSLELDKEFNVELKLYEILSLSRYIAESHKDDPELICITCVGGMAQEDDLYVDFIDFSENAVLTVIYDNSTMPEPYAFEFLSKYTGEEKSPEMEIEQDAFPDSPNEEA